VLPASPWRAYHSVRGHRQHQDPAPAAARRADDAAPGAGAALVQALGEQRLVLLVAPGGGGKTALLVRALEQLPAGHGAAWVSLDADDDLHRLLQCLWRALEPFDLPWRTSPEALATMAASRDTREQQQAADEILNTFDRVELAHGVIALDDLHHMSTTPRRWPSSTGCCRACPTAGPWLRPRATSRRCAWRGCAPPAC
jgi:hypothetical protein